jgi:hypothetical protein
MIGYASNYVNLLSTKTILNFDNLFHIRNVCTTITFSLQKFAFKNNSQLAGPFYKSNNSQLYHNLAFRDKKLFSKLLLFEKLLFPNIQVCVL